MMKQYVNLLLSAAGAAMVSGGVLAATTADARAIFASCAVAAGTAIVQHLRAVPNIRKASKEAANEEK